MHNYTPGPPAEEILPRVARLQSALQEADIDAALIVQNTDLYYFSGTSQQGWLYIPAEGEALLMVYKEFERARAESPLERIVSLVSPRKIPATLEDYGYRLPGKLGMELDVLPANLYLQFSSIFGCRLDDIFTSIRLIRAVKSPFEIERMRFAAGLADKVAARVPEILEPGKTEITAAGELEAYARSLGHQGIVRMRLFGGELFYGHLLSGAAAAVPSYLASPTGGEGASELTGQGAGFKKMERGEMVLVDYVFAYNGYICDHARIFALGDLPAELYKAHDAMLVIQEKTASWAVPGAVCGDIYQRMLDAAAERGYGDTFMGLGERKIRFTGHGVGLEIDEFPFIAKNQKLELAENMVIALEPKVILPGIGVAGIENTHLVTASGLQSLSRFADAIHTVSD
ncbi:MAG TPA: Xaa-Pro peptidase family protein [Desulfopila sp.]|nr:Xaa-Pro peptidase family protein [Desulfopila sp.]